MVQAKLFRMSKDVKKKFELQGELAVHEIHFFYDLTRQCCEFGSTTFGRIRIHPGTLAGFCSGEAVLGFEKKRFVPPKFSGGGGFFHDIP